MDHSGHVAGQRPRLNAAALGRVLADRASRCASLRPGPSCPGPRGAFGVSCYQEEGVPPHSWALSSRLQMHLPPNGPFGGRGP